MLKNPIVLAGGGVGILAAAAAAYFFLFASSGGAVEEPVELAEPTPVVVAGKVGPHITLESRVFNLLVEPGEPPAYLKLRTLIEFETFDEHWAYVLHGCVFSPGAEGGGAGPCAAEEAVLLAEFEEEIGSGRALIEDAVTTIVSGRTIADISTEQGKGALWRDIREAVAQLIPEPHVRRVLFTDFITQ